MVLTLYLGVFVDCRIFPLKDIYREKSLNKALKEFSEGRKQRRSSLAVAYPSTMSSPYFTGTLVEEVVEMFSCSGEYIGHS